MSGDAAFDDINEAKASMGHIYNQPDPRPYFRELKGVGYAIPGVAKPIFRKLISHLRRRRNDTVHVLDLGCSYGVNAALLKHDLSMSELYEHWGQDNLSGASAQEVVAQDQCFFAAHDDRKDIEVIGLDPAEHAVEYAQAAGLLDEGMTVNLEVEPLPAPMAEELASVSLVVSTGCVGYVTGRTFERLMPAVSQSEPPWLANFVLRMFPFDDIANMLGDRGYVTEKLQGHTFVQRRFASSEEQEQVLEQLRELDIDPTGKESEGHLLAEFYLSRPRADARREPLEQLALM